MPLEKRNSACQSPPSRGAWIEIGKHGIKAIKAAGRPPRGGRGLKYLRRDLAVSVIQSPPSRGAWIEIDPRDHEGGNNCVAPLAGGVD